MMDLPDKFNDSQLLDEDDKIKLNEALLGQKPIAKRVFGSGWGWCRRVVKVLSLANNFLNLGNSERGLSEFTTTYNELEPKNPGYEESTER